MMQGTISFTVPAIPVAQPRPKATIRAGHAAVYEAAKSHPVHAFKATCRMAAKAAYDGAPLTGPLCVVLVCMFPRPKAMVWKTRPMPRVWKPTKPDCDNVFKSAADALTGTLWADDAQIVFSVVKKFFAAGDEQPHVTVTVEQMPS